MKSKAIFLCLFIFLLFFIHNLEAQKSEDDGWKIMFHIQGGVFGNGGGSSFEERFVDYYYNENLGRYEFVDVGFTGEHKYKIGALFCAGIEISKGYIGFQGNFGVTPANMALALKIPNVSSTPNAESKQNITTFYGEGAILFFPTGNGLDKISPYLSIGAGGCKFKGTIGASGYLISFGGGVRIFFTKKSGLIVGIKGFLMDFEDTPGVYGAGMQHKFKPLQATCGFIYSF